MKPVHVLGAGSIGTLFAHHLAAAGIPCTLLLRTPAHLKTLQQLDYRVTVDEPTADGSHISKQQTVAAEVAAPQTPHHSSSRTTSSSNGLTASPIQQLILTTKANHAIPALAAVQHRLSSDSVVVLLQNGVLGVYMQAVQELFPHSSSRPAFLLGSTTHGAYRRSPFHVVHGSSRQGTCVFGLPSQQLSTAAQQAAAAAVHGQALQRSSSSSKSSKQPHRQTGPDIQQCHPQQQQQQMKVQDMLSLLSSVQDLHPNTQLNPDELHQQLLLKLLVNCCANPLSALLHCRNGGLVDSSHTAAIWRGIISECKQVFGSMLPGSEDELFQKVHHVVKINSTNYNSMLQDVVHKSHTEVDYLNGFVVRQGAAQGVKIPVNEMLTLLVKAREDVPNDLLTKEQL